MTRIGILAAAAAVVPLAVYGQAVPKASQEAGAQTAAAPLEVCLSNKDQAVVTAALAAAHGPKPPVGCFNQQEYAQAIQALAMADPAIGAMIKSQQAAQAAAQIASQEGALTAERQAEAEARARMAGQPAVAKAETPPRHKP